MTANVPARELKTINVAMEIIDYVKENQGVTAAEIGEMFEMAESTVYGYLTTLSKNGLLTKIGQEYYLGLKLLNLGEYARNRSALYPLTNPYVIELSQQIGEGTDFVIEENGRLIAIYNSVDNVNDPNFRAGRYFYMHNSASGKAILAEMSDNEIDTIIDRWGLPKETENTITDRDELFAEVEQIRSKGYAVSDEELRTGVRAVGVTVHYPDGEVFGSLGVGGPTYRLNENQIHNKIPKELKSVTNSLEREIAQAMNQSDSENVDK